MTGPFRSQFDWTLQHGWRRGQQRNKQSQRAAMVDEVPNPFTVVEGLGQDLEAIDALMENDPAQARSLCSRAGEDFEQHRIHSIARANTRAETEARQAVYDAQRATGLRI